MMRFSTLSLGALLLAVPLGFGVTPAFAQDAPPTSPAPDAKDAPAATDAPAAPKAVTVTGSVTLISDYRFRGVTQTNGDGAVQGTINVNSKYGFYVGTWASTIDGSGKTPALTGYGDAEVDLYGGYTKTFSGLTVDGGVLYYYYPSRVKGLNTDFFEPYASVSYTIGPVGAKVGGAYAWGGQAGLRGFDVRGGNDDNIYAYGEATIAVPKTPVTLKGHLGYSDGSLGSLNPVGSGDNNYFDWSVNAEAVGGPFKVGVSYIDTDISERSSPTTGRYGFARNLGRGSTVLGYVSVGF